MTDLRFQRLIRFNDLFIRRYGLYLPLCRVRLFHQELRKGGASCNPQ